MDPEASASVFFSTLAKRSRSRYLAVRRGIRSQLCLGGLNRLGDTAREITGSPSQSRPLRRFFRGNRAIRVWDRRGSIVELRNVISIVVEESLHLALSSHSRFNSRLRSRYFPIPFPVTVTDDSFEHPTPFFPLSFLSFLNFFFSLSLHARTIIYPCTRKNVRDTRLRLRRLLPLSPQSG